MWEWGQGSLGSVFGLLCECEVVCHLFCVVGVVGVVVGVMCVLLLLLYGVLVLLLWWCDVVVMCGYALVCGFVCVV